jgi:hypothetical protein
MKNQLLLKKTWLVFVSELSQQSLIEQGISSFGRVMTSAIR